MNEPWTVPAVVVRWIDGDSAIMSLDLGWSTWRLNQSVRLLDPSDPARYFDAPERGRPGWAEARDAAERLAPVGSTVRITSRRLDSFGRVLGSVTLPDGRDLVAALGEVG